MGLVARSGTHPEGNLINILIAASKTSLLLETGTKIISDELKERHDLNAAAACRAIFARHAASTQQSSHLKTQSNNVLFRIDARHLQSLQSPQHCNRRYVSTPIKVLIEQHVLRLPASFAEESRFGLVGPRSVRRGTTPRKPQTAYAPSKPRYQRYH
jgi:hypothetical protein